MQDHGTNSIRGLWLQKATGYYFSDDVLYLLVAGRLFNHLAYKIVKWC